MNSEPRPSTQMPVGKARSAPAAVGDDWRLLERGLFIRVVIAGGPASVSRSFEFPADAAIVAGCKRLVNDGNERYIRDWSAFAPTPCAQGLRRTHMAALGIPENVSS